jgi:hypothetical protein
MEISEVSAIEYDAIFTNPSHVFNKASFNALNASKCEQVYYLVFKDTKIRLGIIFGLKNNCLNAPFSAPFGGFECVSTDVRLQQIDAALLALNEWASNKKIKEIKIVTPPFFYNDSFLNKLYNCLYRANYLQKSMELNYQFATHTLDENYMETIWYNACKNLKRGLKEALTFKKLEKANQKHAFDIIVQNRKERGFPLRMTWEQVEETSTVIPIDFFTVNKAQTAIGAAVVFHVAPRIVQVVYWGDLPAYSEYKTMNFLSYSLFNYYQNQDIKIIDIGPSTENSIPNYGLCEFKESIGCDIAIKTVFSKSFI